MRLLLVHGRAQGGRDPVALRQGWIDSLKLGFQAATGRPLPPALTIELPYYGDALDQLVARAGAGTNLAARGPQSAGAYGDFSRAVLLELAEQPMLKGDLEAKAWAQNLGEKGPLNWRWVHAIAGLADRRLGPLVDFTIERFITDVYLYLANRPGQQIIDSIVGQALSDTGEPTIVVSHSLGTVVAYRVMAATAVRQHYVKHITVGSPLGLKAIAARLGVPVNPATQGWYNAYDRDDLVALVPLDAAHFPTTPPIENDSTVANTTDNQHSITGYLSHPRLAHVLAASLDSRP